MEIGSSDMLTPFYLGYILRDIGANPYPFTGNEWMEYIAGYHASLGD